MVLAWFEIEVRMDMAKFVHTYILLLLMCKMWGKVSPVLYLVWQCILQLGEGAGIHPAVKFDWAASLTGTGDRSEFLVE